MLVSIPCLVCISCGRQLEDSHQYSAVGLVVQELWFSNPMLCNRHSVEELDSVINNECHSC